jgi:hypothetical protein
MHATGRSVAALILACWLAGCVSTDLSEFRTRLATTGNVPADVSQLPVISGQVIVNEQATATSLLVTLMAERFTRYTHVGLIIIDEGQPYVYESMGTFLPLPWRPPNAGMLGGVRRVTLAQFVGRGGTIAIYDPEPGVDRVRLESFARARLREGRGFDGHYDPRDDSRYYCVEFVARALEAAGGRPAEPVPASRNPSLQVALQWLGIETPELLLAGDLVDESRRSLLLSQRFNPREVERYFALKQELHRRFTADQKLGHLFQWHGQGLRFRPGVDRFTDDAMRSSEEPRAFADRVFGPL